MKFQRKMKEFSTFRKQIGLKLIFLLLLINLRGTASNKALHFHKVGGLSRQMMVKFKASEADIS